MGAWEILSIRLILEEEQLRIQTEMSDIRMEGFRQGYRGLTDLQFISWFPYPKQSMEGERHSSLSSFITEVIPCLWNPELLIKVCG